jgi:GNAT superfamily N-acetyltransferase
VIIESIQKDKHRRLDFTCGNESLDRFLHESALQAVVKGLSKTYVAVEEDDETSILGYYTVTTTRIEASEMPDRILRTLTLSKHDLPASLVARLAVSEHRKKQGIGGLMLFDAMARCARVASDIGGVAIVVDALNESVIEWYPQFGFTRFEPNSRKMCIPMVTVRQLLGVREEPRPAGSN